MKFLIIAGYADSLIAFRKPLIMALLDRGLNVHVAAPELSSNKKVMTELARMGVVAHDVSMRRTGTNPIADLYALFSLWGLMRQVNPRYVLGYTVKPVIYGTIAAWLSRVPQRFALITGLGFAFIEGKDSRRSLVRTIVQGLYRTALRRCNVVFFQNPDDETLFRKLRILPEHVSTCIVNGSGVDVTHFEASPVIGETTPRFLLIARLLGDKGVREYVRAAAQVKKYYPHVQFDLVGWIDVNPNAITQAELDQWVDAGVINFLGRLSDVRPVIKNCSVYVLPSYREGTPRTVLEAMSMARPVITTDAPGCRETVVNGYNGFLIPVKDPIALAQAMRRFIEQPELILEMGSRSRLMAEEKYDVGKVSTQMLKGMGLEW